MKTGSDMPRAAPFRKAAAFSLLPRPNPRARRPDRTRGERLSQRIGIAASFPAPASGECWKVDDRVFHKTFGAGRILSVTPMGNDHLLAISFEGTGTKKIMANFAHLKRMD